MTCLLHIDSSPRPGRAGEHPHGSQTRRLTHAFVTRWQQREPDAHVLYRDIGAMPPRPVHHEWIPAAFSHDPHRTPAQQAALRESDAMVGELRAADVLVVGLPMYNFGMPAPLKAWLDNIVRIGVTFGVDPSLPDPYVPLLTDRPRRAVILTSRGAHGYGPGGPYAAMNHADTALRDVLGFLGITEVRTIAVEHEEDGGPTLEASVAAALRAVDALVADWAGRRVAEPA